MPQKQTVEERFWSKVNKNGPVPTHVPELGKCWVWTAVTGSKGYGVFHHPDPSLRKAHRAAFAISFRIHPRTAFVCHKCDNPACVNPSHLVLGDNSSNVRDMVDRGRVSRPSLRKTHCPHGHPYSDENTCVTVSSVGVVRRHCRACRLARSRASKKYFREYFQTKGKARRQELKQLRQQ